MNSLLHEVAVNAIIQNDDRVLLIKRADNDAWFPGYYTVPGGKVEGGESVEEALRREVREESGLTIDTDVQKAVPLEYIHSKSYVKQNGNRILSLLFLVRYTGGDVKINSEFSEYAWVGKEDFGKYQIIEEVRENLMKVL